VTTLARHALELLGVAVVLAGPLPLCLTLARAGAGLADHALATLVAWCAVQAGVALALGLAGWLRPGPLLAAELGLLALTAPRLRTVARLPRPVPPLEPLEWLTVAAVAALGVTLLLRAMAQVVTEHDSLGYHLPALARWVHAGALLPLERSDQIGHYPYGWELLSTLLVVPLRDDLLVCLPNLVAWLVVGLAVHAIARTLGAARLHAMAAAFAVLALPVTREQVGTMHVDLALAAFVLAGLRFALARDGAMLLVALALAAAVKTSGVLYAVLLLAAFALAPAGTRSPRRSRAALVPVVAALCAGIVWYVRNLAAVRNPLGLVRVAVGGFTILPGTLEPAAIRRSTLVALFQPTQLAHWAIVGRMAWKALGPPGCLLTVASLGLLRPAIRPRGPVALVVAFFAACAAAYVATPFSGDNGAHGWRLTPWAREGVRYALPCLGALGVLGAVGATRIAGPGIVGAAVVAVSAAVADAYTPAAVVLVGLGAAALLGRRPAVVTLSAALLLAAVVGGSSMLRHRRAEDRLRRYGSIVERLAEQLPPGAAVAHVATAFSYPLYGVGFGNRVTCAPATSDDRDAWIRALRARDVALVAVGPLEPHQRRRRELGWLADPAGPFVRVAGEDPVRETVLYRLQPPD
jgi:hypothetical protein